MPAKQTPDSFWGRVKKCSSGCWEWQGSCNNLGYGTVSWHGTVYTAHRVAAWLSGIVDSPSKPQSTKDKRHVLHKCDNRKCCNPDHFFLGNYADNQRDAYAKTRRKQPRGCNHANAKLSPAQVLDIRRRYKETPVSQETLAKEFGVSQRAISLLVRGESYT